MGSDKEVKKCKLTGESAGERREDASNGSRKTTHLLLCCHTEGAASNI